MAKMEITFCQFPNFVAVEKKDGVDLGETYHNEIRAKEFYQLHSRKSILFLHLTGLANCIRATGKIKTHQRVIFRDK